MMEKPICEKFASEHGILLDRITGSEIRAVYLLERSSQLYMQASIAEQERLVYDPSWGFIHLLMNRIYEHVAASFIQYCLGFPASGEIIARTAIESSVNVLYVMKSKNRTEKIFEFLTSYIEQERNQNAQWKKVINNVAIEDQPVYIAALSQKAQYLDKTYGVGPHTISVPRICPAPGVDYKPAYPVSDDDFLKLIAILRLAVPYTGMIISTRESAEIRKIAFKIGISQASAGSVTTTGGYGRKDAQPQFNIHDERSLEDVIKDVINDKMIPSFCTACYRSDRTGARFMKLSKPGEIHKFCRPNALLTFAEYLYDCTTNGITEQGMKLIADYLEQIEDEPMRSETRRRLADIKNGTRDLYF